MKIAHRAREVHRVRGLGTRGRAAAPDVARRADLHDGVRSGDARTDPARRRRAHQPAADGSTAAATTTRTCCRCCRSRCGASTSAGSTSSITSHHAFANRVRPEAGDTDRRRTCTHPRAGSGRPSTRRHEIGGAVGRAVLGAFAATQTRARPPRREPAHRRRRELALRRRPDPPVVGTRVDGRRAAGRHRVLHTRRRPRRVGTRRLLPRRRAARAVQAARSSRSRPRPAPGVKLVVAGDGRARGAVEAAAGPTVEILGRVDDDAMRDLYRNCRALLFPGEEDFGIMPVEAQACGAPVIARAVGGVLDTVVPGTTGVLYPATTDTDHVETLSRVLRDFDDDDFDRSAIRAHAERFAPGPLPRGLRRGASAAAAGAAREPTQRHDEAAVRPARPRRPAPSSASSRARPSAPATPRCSTRSSAPRHGDGRCGSRARPAPAPARPSSAG